MKYLTAHPKIKEIVARNYFTTSMDVERNLSIGAQTLVCSEFFEQAVKWYGAPIVEPLLDFLDKYVGTHPHVGTEQSILEFCSFLRDDSRDGIQFRIIWDGEEFTDSLALRIKIVQLSGIFGVTTEKVLLEKIL